MNTVTNKEHFLGLIDWVEAHRPETLLGRIYCKGSEDESVFVVSSGRRFPVGKVDFGWGMPVFGSCYFPTVERMDMCCECRASAGREGDWIAYIRLLKEHIMVLERLEMCSTIDF
ncbi:hypothetical protein MRB53_022286 [Persea americana]|uniref:Uncharacterized protein n=1 Tax=Persea americana TaxID=3435 RepID=A0ACC2L7E4_PERAE|nr:hypothetical protein MRB53_022286 [Persea americana]